MVSPRGLEVLRAIVQDYVSTREPVGSKAIVERHSFGVSAATIRNDMSALEEEELIAAPHTSSGRVPTDKGYRMFVDHLAEMRPLSTAQRHAIEVFLGESVDLDDVFSRTVRLLSQLTRQVAIVQYPAMPRTGIRHVEFVPLTSRRLLVILITDGGIVEQRVVDLPDDVDETTVSALRGRFNALVGGVTLADAVRLLRTAALEPDGERPDAVAAVARALAAGVEANRHDRLVMAGTANLVRTETDFSGSIYPVLEAIEEQVVLLKLFGELRVDARGVAVSIGRENEPFGLGETSILTSGFAAGGSSSKVGVLGPTRMDYSVNMAAVRAVARYLTRLLGDDTTAA